MCPFPLYQQLPGQHWYAEESPDTVLMKNRVLGLPPPCPPPSLAPYTPTHIVEESFRILLPCLGWPPPTSIVEWILEHSHPPSCPKHSSRVTEYYLWYLRGSDQFQQATFVVPGRQHTVVPAHPNVTVYLGLSRPSFGTLGGMQADHLVGLRSSISFCNEYSST